MNRPPTSPDAHRLLSRTALPRLVRTPSLRLARIRRAPPSTLKMLTTLHGSPSHISAPRCAAAFRQPIALQARLFRDGFHALAFLPSAAIIGAVPGSIVTLGPGESEFRQTHAITRGTRPLHITATPGGAAFWGNISTTPSATKSISTARRMRAQAGASPTHSAKAQSTTCTTSFTIPGVIAFGFSLAIVATDAASSAPPAISPASRS